MFPIQALKMRNPGAATPTAPTPPTATYEYDFTGRPWVSQAMGPAALYHAASDKTYVTWEAKCQFRHIKIASYDHATGTWSTPVVIDSHVLDDDDHGVPALEVLSDGRLVCFYGSHNSNQEWSISGQSGGVPTITSWTRQTAISGSYAYPKPVNIDSGSGAGTLHLFMRKNSGANYTLVLRKATYTSGGAVSFGADASLIDLDGGSGARVYAMEVARNSGNIEFCATRADSGDTIRQHVYYFRYIVSTGAIQNLVNSVSTASGSLPINLTTANSSYREKTSSGSNITGGVSWCRDSNGYLHILYGDDTTTPFDLKHDWHNGTAWQGETTVATTNYFSGAGYVSDWCLVPRGTSVDAYYATNNNGGFTGYGGDDIGRKVWSGGSWGAEVLVLEGDEVTALGFPTAVRDADADFRVMFSETAQDAILESWGARRRYFLGDSGYLEWPEPSDPDAFKNILVLNFEGANNATSYSDESGWKNRHTIAFNGNAKLDTATAPPWGTSWLKLDGTGDYLTITQSRASLPADGDWGMAGGDTVEIVFELNQTGKTQYLVSTRPAGTAEGVALIVNSSNTLQLVGWSGGSQIVNIVGGTALSTGNVYKGGFTRKLDGSWELRLGGASEGTAATANTSAGFTSLYIGRNGNSTTNDFNGWIKQIRWTKLAQRDLSVVPSADFAVA